ncbi:hypothetical protein PM082_000065 [Marasmius tenuissimus]|nr:hypothetical protein PM082_000065 [Marasmius tenuissimus]
MCGKLQAMDLQTTGFSKQQSQLSGQISSLWRDLDPSEKEKYKEKAVQLDQAHKQKHPGYRYKPRSKKDKSKKAGPGCSKGGVQTMGAVVENPQVSNKCDTTPKPPVCPSEVTPLISAELGTGSSGIHIGRGGEVGY